MTTKLASIEEYFNPTEEMKKALQDMEMLFQITRQDVMQTYHKHGSKESFKGTLNDWMKTNAMKEYYKDINKPWSYIKHAIFLVDNHTDKIDTSFLSKLNDEDTTRILKMIRDGQAAKPIIEKWLAPLTKSKNAMQAIDDATSVELRRFQILELSTLADHKTAGVKLFPYILQIDSPAELVMYLKHHKEIQDCLIVTIRYNPKREWKSFFYIFMVCNGKLYSVDNSDQRLNEDNTNGDRNPDRYLERAYEKVWLPLHLIYEKKGDSSKMELMLPNSKVFKLKAWEDYVVESPEYIYWLSVFMRRVMDSIETKRPLLGVTNDELPKLLGSGKLPKYKEDPTYLPQGACSYLADLYGSKCKAIVPKASSFSMVVGTREHMEQLVAYKSRQEQAKQLQKIVESDFNRNYKRVYDTMKGVVRAYGYGKLVQRAFEDKQYTYEYFARFGVDHGIGPKPDAIEGKSEIRKKGIFRQCKWYGHCDNSHHVFLNNEWIGQAGRMNHKCLFSPNGSSFYYELSFKDYHQFIEFFELQEKDVPKELIQHLHQQSELYTGNWILYDTDPVDGVFDPWFVKDTPKHERFGWGGCNRDTREIQVRFALCKRCVKSICHRIGVDYIKWTQDLKW